MNTTTETDLQLGALALVHQTTLQQLDVLRQTRPQREVGAVRVPTHLTSPDVINLPGRITDPRACNGCGRGLQLGDLGRFCRACLANPSTDAGVEARADRAAGILPAV